MKKYISQTFKYSKDGLSSNTQMNNQIDLLLNTMIL